MRISSFGSQHLDWAGLDLALEATLTQKQYEVGLKVKDQEMKELNFERRRICPQWNYVFKPRRLSSA